MTTPNLKCNPAQYLEANRLHREGFVPVSSKYRRARCCPRFPPDDQLLDLLKRLDGPTYENLRRTIEIAITRVVGEREVTLDFGTYEALKTIERERMAGLVADSHLTVGRPPRQEDS